MLVLIWSRLNLHEHEVEDRQTDRQTQRSDSSLQLLRAAYLSLSLFTCFPPLITCLITELIHYPGVDQHLEGDSGTDMQW